MNCDTCGVESETCTLEDAVMKCEACWDFAAECEENTDEEVI